MGGGEGGCAEEGPSLEPAASTLAPWLQWKPCRIPRTLWLWPAQSGENLPKSAAQAVGGVNHVKRERDKMLEKARIRGSNSAPDPRGGRGCWERNGLAFPGSGKGGLAGVGIWSAGLLLPGPSLSRHCLPQGLRRRGEPARRRRVRQL